MRLVEFHPGKAVFFRVYRGCLLKLAVPGFGGDPHGLGQGFEGIPVPILCPQGRGVEALVGTDGDGVAHHILIADIHRLPHGKAQSLALTLCVAGRAPVPAYHLPLKVQKVTLGEGLSGVALQKRAVIPVGNEADVLTVPLPGVDKTVFPGDFPDLRLGQISQRKPDLGKLFLIPAGQEVGRLLVPVRRLC